MRCFSVMPSRNSMAMKACAVLLADIVNGADIGMVQCGRGLGFALETGQGLRVASNIFGQEFQRDKAVQPSVFSLVDHTHPAATEFFHDAVVRDGLADHSEMPGFRVASS